MLYAHVLHQLKTLRTVGKIFPEFVFDIYFIDGTNPQDTFNKNLCFFRIIDGHFLHGYAASVNNEIFLHLV